MEDSQLGFQGWKLITEQPKATPTFYSVGFVIHAFEKTEDIEELRLCYKLQPFNRDFFKIYYLTIRFSVQNHQL
jgi:hypothetical protein